MPRFITSVCVLVCFCFTSILPSSHVFASNGIFLNLPKPGTMVALSPKFDPLLLQGLMIDPKDPLHFDFIVDPGQNNVAPQELTRQTTKLVRYFLAAIAVPEQDLWVNLSPYEAKRIVPTQLGMTDMGRDLLAQDYLLKQLSASLMYPEGEVGKKFWEKVYAKARSAYGKTDIAVNTFNKVWVVPQEAVVYQHGTKAYIAQSHLKVMLQEDYLAKHKNECRGGSCVQPNDTKDAFSSQIIRDIILPQLEREVNESKNYAQLRQIFSAVILAHWFKNNLKDTLVNQVYADSKKINGITIKDKASKEKIYQTYLEAYRKGVYNYIKEEEDSLSHTRVPRKYFSGGFNVDVAQVAQTVEKLDQAQIAQAKEIMNRAMVVPFGLKRVAALDRAQTATPNQKNKKQEIADALKQQGVSVSSDHPFSSRYPTVAQEQARVQNELENRLSTEHNALMNGSLNVLGAYDQVLVDQVLTLVKKISTSDHLVILSSEDTLLAQMVLQVLTKTSSWNDDLKTKVHFLNSNDPLALKRLLKQKKFFKSGQNVTILSSGNAISDAMGVQLKEQLPNLTYTQENLGANTQGLLPLVTAGVVKADYVQEIYEGAKASLQEQKALNTSNVKSYGPYQFAVNPIRFAMTGQNVSVFMIFSKKFEKFGQWLSALFNREIANAPINLEVTSGLAPDSRHAKGQSEVGSKGFGFNAKVREQENKGFIGMVMMRFREATGNARAIITGKVLKNSKGFGWNDKMDMDYAAQKLALTSNADRSVIDVEIRVESPKDLGRMIHMGQVSALMAARLAGARPSESKRSHLEQAISEKQALYRQENKTVDQIPPAQVVETQNILSVTPEGELKGVIGSRVQAELNAGNRARFDYTVNSFGRMVSKSVLPWIVNAINDKKDLIHLDPHETRKAIPVAKAWADRFKNHKRIYICAIGGSVFGKYLVNVLNIIDGPEIIFVPNYDADSITRIKEDIKNNPGEIGLISISKSGTTDEVNLNGGSLEEQIKKSYEEAGVNYKEHVLLATDPQEGDERKRAKEEGYLTLIHQEHGGRFTTWSTVGLLPYFLKGGSVEDLEQGILLWEADLVTLKTIAKRFKTDKTIEEKFNLERKYSDQERIRAMGEVLDLLKQFPGLTRGFLSTYMNVMNQVDPKFLRDTQMDLTLSGNLGQFVTPTELGIGQLIVESTGRAGKRSYENSVDSLGAIEQQWDRIITNGREGGRNFICLYGESLGEQSPDAIKEQATWDALQAQLTENQIPVNTLRMGPMNAANYMTMLRSIYFQLEVSMRMHTKGNLTSTGQPAVTLAKNIAKATTEAVNAAIRQEGAVTQEDIERRRASYIQEHGVPEIEHTQVEHLLEKPMDLERSLPYMDQDLRGFVNGYLRSNSASLPGFATKAVREKWQKTPKGEIIPWIQSQIRDFVAQDQNIGTLILDGQAPQTIHPNGRFVVYAKSIDSKINLHVGGVNSTYLVVFERNSDGSLQQKPKATVWVHWGPKTRVTVSDGVKSQDYRLMGDELVEVKKADEENYLKMAKIGQYLSLGGDSNDWPKGLESLEAEVLWPSESTKIRHNDVSISDAGLMFGKKGMMGAWMTWGEAVGMSQVMESADALAMVMTNEGLKHISDIPLTEEMLTSSKQVYVFAGVKSLVLRAQTWFNFLNVRDRHKPVKEAPVFQLLKELANIPKDAPASLKAQALVLLLRLKQGLDTFPGSENLTGDVKTMVDLLTQKINQGLSRLNQDDIVTALQDQYLSIPTLDERRKRQVEFLLLGQEYSSLGAKLESGEPTKVFYELQTAYEKTTAWQILSSLKVGLTEQANSTNKINIANFGNALSAIQASYQENTVERLAPEDVVVESRPFGVNSTQYLKDNLLIPAGAGLTPRIAKELKEKAVGLKDDVERILRNGVVLIPSEQETKLQKECIAKLRASEPEVFDEDGNIHDLKWIINNIPERKNERIDLNSSTDIASRLDNIFFLMFTYDLVKSADVTISEEAEYVIIGNKGNGKAGYRLALFSDPIDGSSNVEDDGNFGTIKTLAFLKPGQEVNDGTFDPRRQFLFGFDYQYGITTQMTLVLPSSVNNQGKAEVCEFMDTGAHFQHEFSYLSAKERQRNMVWGKGLLPDFSAEKTGKGIYYALGGSFKDSTQVGYPQLASYILRKGGRRSAYTGALIFDQRKLVLATSVLPNSLGVWESYMKTNERPRGRFRYTFEGIYYYFMYQALGLEVTDGEKPLVNNPITGEDPGAIELPFSSSDTWISKIQMAWEHYIKKHGLKSEEEINKGFVKFIDYYTNQTQRLLDGIVKFSKKTGQKPVTVEEARGALLDWDSEQISFSSFLEMSAANTYRILFGDAKEITINEFHGHLTSVKRRDFIDRLAERVLREGVRTMGVIGVPASGKTMLIEGGYHDKGTQGIQESLSIKTGRPVVHLDVAYYRMANGPEGEEYDLNRFHQDLSTIKRHLVGGSGEIRLNGKAFNSITRTQSDDLERLVGPIAANAILIVEGDHHLAQDIGQFDLNLFMQAPSEEAVIKKAIDRERGKEEAQRDSQKMRKKIKNDIREMKNAQVQWGIMNQIDLVVINYVNPAQAYFGFDDPFVYQPNLLENRRAKNFINAVVLYSKQINQTRTSGEVLTALQEWEGDIRLEDLIKLEQGAGFKALFDQAALASPSIQNVLKSDKNVPTGGIDLGGGKYLKVVDVSPTGIPLFNQEQLKQFKADFNGFIPVVVGMPRRANLSMLGLGESSRALVK